MDYRRVKLSRRQLTKRAEQGRQAMKMLAAVVSEYGGGIVRVPIGVYQQMDPTTRVEVELDAEYYILKVKTHEDDTAQAETASR